MRILLMFFVLFLAGNTFAQIEERPLKKEGKYHVQVENMMVFTDNLYAFLNNIQGETKLIMKIDEAEERDYTLSDAAVDLLSNYVDLGIYPQMPWRDGLCNCWNSEDFIVMGCVSAEESQDNCGICCEGLVNELKLFDLENME